MTNFPSATQRTPDLFNLILINKEIVALEEDILDARYIGLREQITNDTDFTNPVFKQADVEQYGEIVKIHKPDEGFEGGHYLGSENYVTVFARDAIESSS